MRIVWFCLALAAAAPADLAAAPALEKVVMVSRHGIRSPLRSVAVFQALTKRGWPAWPVGPGEMTEHGARDLALMADYLRGVYTAAGALTNACVAPGAPDVWADVADHRTRQSGDIFADHLAPGCKLSARHAADGTADPLFDATKSNACPIGLFTAGRALLAATRGENGLLRPEDRHALEVLQGILAPDACKEDGKGICLVPDADASRVTAATQLALGAMVAEGLYLQYAQGFPPADVGWGKAANPETIAAIIPAHERGIDLRRRTAVLAARRGALMARTILALLEGHSLPEGAPGLSPDATVVMLAGHDSNLLYMGALMGLDWQLPDQPSVTAPDTTLAFEVWRDAATGQRIVRVVVYAQTLEQLRNATPLDAAHPPDVVAVVPEACAATQPCALSTFTGAVERQLASLCGG